MIFGIPKEKHLDERRVALAPAGVDSLIREGHTVYIQNGAGERSGFNDEEYKQLGAKIVYNISEVYQRSECILKISRLTDDEADLLQENQILFNFLHLAVSHKKIVQKLLQKKITAIGMELIEDEEGLPILHSMSEIAGQLAIQIGEQLLESSLPESRGILMGGITGVAPASVVILGAGVVGTWAARAALGRGAQVIVLDKDLTRLRRIDETFQKKVTTVVANPYTILRGVKFADVLIGAVLIKGERTPHLVNEEMVKTMKPGAVIVDVSIDQGGCVATSRPTTISQPTFVAHNVIHYCVPNFTAIVPRTASYAVTNSAMKFILEVANHGPHAAIMGDHGLSQGVCTYNGFCTNEIIAEIFNLEYRKIRIFSTN